MLRFLGYLLILTGSAIAQIPGRNINMVSGTKWPDGDPFLQRQNEPSVAVSTRNPLHVLSGANDYRTVDLPGLLAGETADAWLGLFKSYDGGQTWRSTVHPGCPQRASQCDGAPFLKSYAAGADPVVRAGSNGMFYMSAIAFTRESPMKSVVFVSRLIDNNNEDNGDSIKFIDSTPVHVPDGIQFADKPWIAVDIPRANAGMCTVTAPQSAGNPVSQTFPAGNVYLAFTTFTSETQPPSQILFSRSRDCGATWTRAITLGSAGLNQGANVQVDPITGAVYVVWRRFKSAGQTDAILFVRSSDGGLTFSEPREIAAIDPFDQGTSLFSFRTNAYPTMAVDGTGRLYVAWAERGFGAAGDARVVLTTSRDAVNWTPRAPVGNFPARGHQFMPAMAFGGGKLMVVFYDLRQDNTIGVFTPAAAGQYDETRVPAGDLATRPPQPDKVFTRFVLDAAPAGLNQGGLLRRHTVDVWSAQADPADVPIFTTTRVSQYIFGSRPGVSLVEQLQVNPPNLPIFRQGTAPFLGDYLDVAASPSMLPGDQPGTWKFNTEASRSIAFHAVWTDNRDVRPPIDGDWTNYTPPISLSSTGSSIFDPARPQPVCKPGQAGMRNQNIYTARITQGLFVSSPSNSKRLGSLQRAFPVVVSNSTGARRAYRLTIANQPPSGKASFLQFPTAGLPDPLTTLDVTVPAISSISRMVFVQSADPLATVRVEIAEIAAAGAALVPNGLQGTVVLNPDIASPAAQASATSELFNPDIANPDIANPDIANPDIANPDIANPDIANPDIANPDIANPDIANPDIANPDIANPDIANPDIANPDIANPDIANGAMSDVTWRATNRGNSTAVYALRFLLNGVIPARVKTQLLVHKTYLTPVVNGCALQQQPQPVLLSNVPRPPIVTQGLAQSTTDSSDATTVSIGPNEVVNITLRFTNTDKTQPLGFDPIKDITVIVVSVASNSGETSPRISASHLILADSILPAGVAGATYTLPLTAAGGTAPYRFRLASGSLPPGLSLGGDGTVNGRIDATANGVYSFLVEVMDSSLPVPNVVQQQLAIVVTRVALVISSLQATSGNNGGAARPGDLVTLNIVVQNAGGAVDGVTPVVSVVSTRTASAPCGAPVPPSQSVAAGGSVSFTVTCGPVSGNGTLGFRVELNAVDRASGAAFHVDPSVSNPLDVAGAPPTFTAEAPGYTPGTWSNHDVVVRFTCLAVGGETIVREVTVSSEGANQTATTTCTDAAGNTTTVSFGGIFIDRTPPHITASAVAGGSPYTGQPTALAVTVSFQCSDGAGSGVQSLTAPVTLNSEGLAQSATGSCVDQVGNSASVTFSPVNIVRTQPQLTATLTAGGAPYTAGTWTRYPVVVTFVCTTGPNIAVASVTAPITLSNDGANQSANGSCTDAAGNSASTSVGSIQIDRTAPVLQFQSAVPVNAAGWSSGPVTVTWSCTDSLSGVAASHLTAIVATQGVNQSADASCTDVAGNTAAATRAGINIDSTPPVIAASVAPAPNAAGWNRTPVTVTFTCTDALSGIAPGSPTGGATLNSDTPGSDLEGGCSDLAGNTASAHSGQIKIDLTPPAIAFVSLNPVTAAGWSNGPVTVTWSCADPLSGVPFPQVTSTVPTQGANQSIAGTCIDMAGNTATDTRGGINIDMTAPVISASALPAPNGAGWNRTPVTVAFNCSDALSGVAPGFPTGGTVLTADTSGTPVNGTCTDRAGNTATASAGPVRIDSTPPVLTRLSLDAPNAAGWNKSPVTGTWSCTDALSGVAASQLTSTVATQGANQSVGATCIDAAGNSVSDTRSGINIDSTPPVISTSVLPAPNAAGWHRTDVTVAFPCSDSLSGVAPGSPSGGATLTAETAGTTVNGACADLAGNTATASAGPIRIDKTAPVTAFQSAAPVNAAGWSNGPVTVTWSCADSLSGPVSPALTQTVTGDGANRSASASCTDLAGNSSTGTHAGIRIDTAPPVLAFLPLGLNPFGWANTQLTVAWSCTDALSGPLAPTGSRQLTTAGADQSVTGTCADLAGNVASGTRTGINIDLTPPTLVESTEPPANAAGWHNTPLTVLNTCTDSLSGVASQSPPVPMSADTLSTIVPMTCTDKAGNVASANLKVKIDQVPPDVIFLAPADGASYANKSTVLANYTCQAPVGSPLAACHGGSTASGAAIDTSIPGTFSMTVTAVDAAGNTRSVTHTYTITP